jgi:hypothetical protein
VIERSVDQATFFPVKSVSARPVVNETESYQAVDDISDLQADRFYYRLRSVMKNGMESLSHTVSLQRETKKAAIKILPNPVTGSLQVQMVSKGNQPVNIVILDATGRVIQKLSEKLVPGINSFIYSETYSYPAGMYYLKADVNGTTVTSKFTVMK